MFSETIRLSSLSRVPGGLLCLLPCLLIGLMSCPLLADSLPSDTQWKDPSSVRLEVDFPGNGYHASWLLFRCTCGDLLVRSELNVPGEVVHGELLMVENRAVLMRGYRPEDADQISFDAPALMMQLGLRLLERSAPDGPSSISEKTEVEVADEIGFINLDTGAAAGTFRPPWSVSGSIWPQNDGQRRFDLVFNFQVEDLQSGETQEGQMRLSGMADYSPGDFPVAGASMISDWTLSWRDEEDAAITKIAGVQTLEQLRTLLKND